jgi:hypothetical protein
MVYLLLEIKFMQTGRQSAIPLDLGKLLPQIDIVLEDVVL